MFFVVPLSPGRIPMQSRKGRPGVFLVFVDIPVQSGSY